MKSIRIIFCVIACLPILLQAQDESGQYIRKGLFRSAGTFASGTLLGYGRQATYLQGTLEYYLNKKISLRSDGYYNVSTQWLDAGTPEGLYRNHQFFSGASYHFKTKSHLDFYCGLQAGFAISNARTLRGNGADEELILVQEEWATNPLLSVGAGLNFYFQKWFHLFLESRFVHGNHISAYGQYTLNELRFSFGLGWNVNFIRRQITTD